MAPASAFHVLGKESASPSILQELTLGQPGTCYSSVSIRPTASGERAVALASGAEGLASATGLASHSIMDPQLPRL